MAKVSVIIPIYNVEDYLAECLESVTGQTYKDLEIICINDCSTDHSLEILEEYAQKDPRIIILQNRENSGQAYTRNIGLKQAAGEYVLFIDSDDVARLDLVESCMEVSECCDMVCFDYSQTMDGEACPRQHAYKMEDGRYMGKFFFAESVRKESIIFAPWSKFFSRRFLIENHISFYNGIIYEDVLFSFSCYISAENVYSLNRKLYKYQIHSHSTMTKDIAGKNIESYVICICELTRLYLQSDFNGEVNRAVEGYIQKACREYISACRKWGDKELQVNLLKDKPECLKLYRTFSGLLSSPGKALDISTEKAEKLRQHQYVLLYGAGDIARGTIESLDRYDIPLYGIAVSDGHKKRKSLLGIPIRELWEYRAVRKECLVLIGTVPRYYAEIKGQLRENGFLNWMEIIEGYEE